VQHIGMNIHDILIGRIFQNFRPGAARSIKLFRFVLLYWYSIVFAFIHATLKKSQQEYQKVLDLGTGTTRVSWERLFLRKTSSMYPFLSWLHGTKSFSDESNSILCL